MNDTIPLNSVASLHRVWYRRYRIVRSDDEKFPYEAQCKRLFWPFWFSLGYVSRTIENATELAIRHSRKGTHVQHL